jgi:myo-inositol-1(or 4)-monophosphatase
MQTDFNSIDIQDALRVAIDAARRGGAIAKARLGSPGYLKWKGDRDVVTEASFAVQEEVVSVLQDSFPSAGILAEEGPEDAPIPVEAPHLWIVDPICGSLNFAQGIPYFAVSIALRSAGRIRVGVVYDPCRDELFEATDRTASELNGRKIAIQQISEGIEAWEAAFIGTDWPRKGDERYLAERIVSVMMGQILEVSVMGSPALGICNVAAGRLHGYWHLDLRFWDMAAASLILDRAGGVLTDIKGNSWLYADGGYVASNQVIHSWILNCVRAVMDHPGTATDKDKGTAT